MLDSILGPTDDIRMTLPPIDLPHGVIEPQRERTSASQVRVCNLHPEGVR